MDFRQNSVYRRDPADYSAAQHAAPQDAASQPGFQNPPAVPMSASPPNQETSQSGMKATARREYDILLAIPGQLAAQAMEWTLTSRGQVRRVRSVQTIDELNDVVNSDWPRLLLLDEDFAPTHLQSITRNLSIRLHDCIVGLFADRLSSRQLHIASNYVSGLLSRQTSVPEFMADLDALNDERKVVASSLKDRVALDSRKRGFQVASVEKIQNLTNRQLEVLVRIAQGMSARQAATDMHITEKAVESHKYRLMRSLGLKDRIDLCRWAIREGIVDA